MCCQVSPSSVCSRQPGYIQPQPTPEPHSWFGKDGNNILKVGGDNVGLGNDVLDGGNGNDTVKGGEGDDTFAP